jgi:ABC-type multidrug transport system fused ATPase/permease subunit
LEGDTRDDPRELEQSAKRESEKVSFEIVVPPTFETHAGSAITITDGSFGWEADKMVLHDININIPRSSLTIICGPIASGKSTLTRALLGEVPVSKGTITLSTIFPRVAYCDQTPFLSNSTIKDNIIGFTPFDAERYLDVIDATLLDVDFETLPLGDRTNIGSNGITLSGGQKQRVSLARALYLQSDLLILDDVFSGLDADTEEQVFKRVFGPEGIVKRRQATAVICTHSVRHLPAASHIIALGINGRVVQQGSWDDLSTNDEGYVHSLGVKASGSDVSSEHSESKRYIVESRPDLLRRTTTASSVISEAADKARQLGDRTVYKHYFRSMGYSVAGSIFFSGAVFGFFYNFPTIWLKFWSDDVILEHPSHTHGYYVGIYALLNMCCLLALLTLGYLLFIVAINRSGANLHQDALRTLVKAPLRFFTATDQGQIVNLFSQDVNLIDTELPNALLNTIFTVFSAIGQAAVLVTSSPYMAISYPCKQSLTLLFPPSALLRVDTTGP